VILFAPTGGGEGNGKTPFSQVTDARRHGDHLRFPERFGNFAMSITPHVTKSAGAKIIAARFIIPAGMDGLFELV
jgi:hypothetical protein